MERKNDMFLCTFKPDNLCYMGRKNEMFMNTFKPGDCVYAIDDVYPFLTKYKSPQVLEVYGPNHIYIESDSVGGVVLRASMFSTLIPPNIPPFWQDRAAPAPIDSLGTATPISGFEAAKHPCNCVWREVLMHGCKCGGY
jgi:hypothetical protein